ncbi:MAG: hypothetical protein P8Y45_16260 [Exilibacterium sp.]
MNKPHYRHFSHALAVILSVAAAKAPQAQEDGFFDIVEVEEEEEEEAPEQDDNTFWTQRGYLQQKIKYGLDIPDPQFGFERQQMGLTQVRTELFAELRHRPSQSFQWQISARAETNLLQWHNGNTKWGSNNSVVFLRDAFFDLTLDSTWLRLGNQVIAWGQSEGLNITDVFSLKDLREPGQSQLQNIRDPIPAAQLFFPLGPGKLYSVLTWSAGLDRYAGFRDEFYSLGGQKKAGVEFDQIAPEEKWEAGLRYLIPFNGGDVNLVTAVINNNTPTVEAISSGAKGDPPTVVFTQKRQTFVGLSASRVISSWVLRSELGYLKDLPTSTLTERQSQRRAMAGVEYAGISNWLFGFEFNGLDTVPTVATTPGTSAWGYMARANYNGFNDRLKGWLWIMKLAQEGASIVRGDLTYHLSDRLQLELGLVSYQSSDQESLLYPFRYHDSVNLAFKYDF